MSKRCTPYTKTSITPQYEYTDEMAKEDYRIAYYCVYKKYPSFFPEISITKEDLMQWCVMRLWQNRPFYNSDKGKYITYAITICRSVLHYAPIIKRQYEDTQFDNLDNVICTNEDGSNVTLFDFLGEYDKEPIDDLVEIVYKAVDNIQSPKFKTRARQVIDLYLSGKANNCKQVATIMGCSREYVRQLMVKIRVNAIQISKTGTCKKTRKRGRPLGCLDKEPRKQRNELIKKQMNR